MQLHTLASREGCASAATVPALALLVQLYARERRCRVNFGVLNAQATAQPGCEETSPDQPLCKLSLPVANFAINLGPLVSPVQEGEMNELFIKRKSSYT
jgi:hypothetical protein